MREITSSGTADFEQWESHLDPFVRKSMMLAAKCENLFDSGQKLLHFVQFKRTNKKAQKRSQALYVYMLKQAGFMPSELSLCLRRDRAGVRLLIDQGLKVYNTLSIAKQNELLELTTEIDALQKSSHVKKMDLQKHMFDQLQSLEALLKNTESINSEKATRPATKQEHVAASRTLSQELETQQK